MPSLMCLVVYEGKGPFFGRPRAEQDSSNHKHMRKKACEKKSKNEKQKTQNDKKQKTKNNKKQKANDTKQQKSKRKKTTKNKTKKANQNKRNNTKMRVERNAKQTSGLAKLRSSISNKTQVNENEEDIFFALELFGILI